MRPHQFGPAVLDGAASGLRIEQGHLRLTLMARIFGGFVPQGQLRSTIAKGPYNYGDFGHQDSCALQPRSCSLDRGSDRH
jgi:hypothetical protein